jgi:hypothetical protein
VELITEWFAQKAPDVALSITRVHEFRDFRSEQDHFRFEKVLYRWMLEVAASVSLCWRKRPNRDG